MRRFYKFERRLTMKVLSGEMMKKVVIVGAMAVGAAAVTVIAKKRKASEEPETLETEEVVEE